MPQQPYLQLVLHWRVSWSLELLVEDGRRKPGPQRRPPRPAALIREGCTVRRLTRMLEARALLARAVSRYQLEVADTRLHYLCKRTTGIRPASNLAVLVRHNDRVSKARLRQAARQLIHSTTASNVIEKHLMSHVRVVSKRRPTVASTLMRHRQFAASLKVEQPPTCRCCNLPASFPRLNGHVVCRSSDLTGQAETLAFLPSQVRTVLRCNAKDVLWPGADDDGAQAEVTDALRHFRSRLQSMGCSFERTPNDDDLSDLARTCILPNARRPIPDGAATVRDAVFTRKWMETRGLIGVEVDKNAGDVGWMCPVALHKLNADLFAPGTHYEAVSEPADVILRRMREAYDALPTAGPSRLVVPASSTRVGPCSGENQNSGSSLHSFQVGSTDCSMH